MRLGLIAVIAPIAFALGGQAVSDGLTQPSASRGEPPAIVDQVGGGVLTALAVRDGVVYSGEGPRIVAYDAVALEISGRLIRVGVSEVLSGTVSAIALVDGLAIAVQPRVGLAVLNTAVPGSIRTLGALSIEGIVAESPVIRNGMAYVPDCVQGLSVVDLRDPTRPTRIASVPLVIPGQPDHHACVTRMAAGASHLYVFFDDATVWGNVSYLAVLELADPVAPTVVGYDHPDVPQARAAVVSGHFLLGAFDDRLVVFDLANPVEPTIVAKYIPAPHYYASGLTLDGAVAYVSTTYAGSDGRSGLAVLDVSEPRTPTEVGFLSMAGDLSTPAIAGGHAFMFERNRHSDGATMLHAVDVSEPGAPRSVSHAPLMGLMVDAAVNADELFAVSNTGRLWSVELTADGRFETAALVEVPWRSSGLAVSGTTLVVAARSDGLRVLDVGNPGRPVEIGSLVPSPESGHQDWTPVVEGHIAYVLGGRPKTRDFPANWSLRIVDLSEPTSPREMSSMSLATGANDVSVRDGLVAVAGESGIELIDAGYGSEPRVIGRIATEGAVRHVVLGTGGIAYATVVNALRIYDLSDPNEPALLADVPLPGDAYGDQYGVATDEGQTFVAVKLSSPTIEGWQQMLVAFDTADPRSVSEAARLGLPGAPSASYPSKPIISPSGDVYVACGGGGLQFVRDPSRARGTIHLPWVARP